MKQESFQFSGVKIVDYRNARYQGYFSADKKYGFGIVVDDDMNFYCSEWDKGQMNGMTFILRNDGRYLYGIWKAGQPYGLNVFKNKQFIIFFNYFRGFANYQAIAVNGQASRFLSFNGQSIKDGHNIQVSSYQIFNSPQIYDDYLLQLAQNNNLSMSKQQVRLMWFMREMAVRHKGIVYFKEKKGSYYFGFEKGLGIKFSASGQAGQHIHRISVGHHFLEQLSQIGIKYHSKQSFEEGNFGSKELISYNNYSGRPKQKCHLIFQNYHKKGLHFINEYFDLKSNMINEIEFFTENKLLGQFKQSQELRKPVQIRENDVIVIEEEKQQNYKQTGGQIESRLQANSANNKTVNIKTKKPKLQRSYLLDTSPNKKTITNPSEHSQRKVRYQDKPIAQLVGELNQLKFQKQIKCERCRSRGKSKNNILNKNSGHYEESCKELSPNKSKSPEVGAKRLVNNKSFVKGKTNQKMENRQKQHIKTSEVSPQKQIKYLKHYKPEQKPKQQQKIDKSTQNNNRQGKSPIKEKSPEIPVKVLKQPKKDNKEEYNEMKTQFNEKENAQLFNEKKIREQIYQQQLRDHAKESVRIRERQIRPIKQRNYYQESLHYPKKHISPALPQEPYQQLISQKKSQRQSHQQYYDKEKSSLSSYLRSTDHVIQDIQIRRQKILKEFQQLNSMRLCKENVQYLPMRVFPQQQSYNRWVNPIERSAYNYSLNTEFNESPRRNAINVKQPLLYDGFEEKRMKSESNQGLTKGVHRTGSEWREDKNERKRVNNAVDEIKYLSRSNRIRQVGNKGSKYQYYFDQQ